MGSATDCMLRNSSSDSSSSMGPLSSSSDDGARPAAKENNVYIIKQLSTYRKWEQRRSTVQVVQRFIQRLVPQDGLFKCIYYRCKNNENKSKITSGLQTKRFSRCRSTSDRKESAGVSEMLTTFINRALKRPFQKLKQIRCKHRE